MANPSNVPKVGRDGNVLFYGAGGAAGANKFAASYARGDVSANAGAKAEMIHFFVRGVHKGTRKGNDPIFEISFTMPLLQFTNGTNLVVTDIFDNAGAVNGVWSKEDDTIEHWNVGMRFTVAGTTHGDSADHYVDFKGCICTWEFGESVNGETSVNVTVTSPRFSEYSKSGPT